MNRRGRTAIVAAALVTSTPVPAQAIDGALTRSNIDALIDAVLSPTSDSGSTARVAQTGFTSRAFIVQAGPGNNAEIDQAGIIMSGIDLPNIAVIGQSGGNGRADIDQAGTGNIAAASQDPSTDRATALIDQAATFNNGATLQRGLGGYSRISQSGGLFGIGAHIALVRQLDGSISILAQQGSEHLALVDQAGFGNQSDLSQRDQGSGAGDEIILTAGVFQTGTDNISELVQDADGAGAFGSLIQVGAAHHSAITQKAAAETLVFQAGIRNVSAVTQSPEAAGSLADIGQLGARGLSTVVQSLGAGTAIIRQDRDSEGAISDVSQDGGDGNEAYVIQGADAWSHISQLGTSNHAIVTQTGLGGVSTVRQSGSGNRTEVNQ